MLLMAVNSQKEICNQLGKDLDHQSILTSGKEVIYIKMPFSPDEKTLDIPVELIYQCNLFSG